MVTHRAVVCRGTTCFRSKDPKQVVKLPRPSDLRLPEADHLRRARDHGVEGVAKLFGHGHVASIKEMRDGLIFPGPQRFRSVLGDASASFSEPQSQVTLSRSFGAFQSLEISRSYLGKRKSVDKGERDSKRSRSNSDT
jgi:hypothetical protein